MNEPRDPALADALYYVGGLLWEWGVLENGLNGAIAALRRGNAAASARPPGDFDKRLASRLTEWRKLQVSAHGKDSEQVTFVDEILADIRSAVEHRHNVAHGIMGAINRGSEPAAIICTVDHYRRTLGGDAPAYEDYDAARLMRECDRVQNLANLVKLATYGRVKRQPRKKGGKVTGA